MKRWKDKIDPKYLKISLYVIIAAVIIFIICLILFHSQGFFSGIWRVLKAVIAPIAIGAIICYLLMPIINFFIRLLKGKSETQKGWVRPVAVVLTILIVLIVITGLLFLLGLFVYRGIKSIRLDDITQLFETLKAQISQFTAGIQDKVEGFELPVDNIENILSDAIGSVGGSLANTIGDIPTAASNILFSVIFSIYFMVDGTRICNYLKRVCKAFTSEKNRDKLRVLGKDANMVFSGYIRGKIIEAIFLGVVCSIAFSIAGVPYAIVTGLFIGLVNLIPYVGNVVSYLIVLLAYLVGGSLPKIWIGLLILTVILVIDAYVVVPKLLNKSIAIHPLLVIAAIIAGGAIGGLVGMLIAIPVMAFLKIQFDRYLERREQNSDSNITSE